MRYSFLLASLAVLPFGSAGQCVEPGDLKPGLIASFTDTHASDIRAARLEPTVAITLARGESPHSRLENGGLMTWEGYVNIVRPGKYRFEANVLAGQLQVKINRSAVLTGTALSTSGLTALAGKEVTLDGGVHPISVIFLRAPRDAATRIELFWSGPGFIKEPLNGRYLGHLPTDRKDWFLNDVREEHGRFLFEELACAKCHQPAAGDAMAKTLVERTGPNLTEVAGRAYPGWIDAWLADPARLRPHTTMPKMFGDDERGRAERYAITRYLISLGGRSLPAYRPPVVAGNEVRQSVERGRLLFMVSGCAACHSEAPAKENGEDEREPLKPEDYLYSLGTLAPAAKYLLGALGSKTRPEALAAYLQDPLKTNPHGRMPNMVLTAREAGDLARYLCRVTDDNVRPGLPTPPRTKPIDLGREVYRELHGPKSRDQLAAFRQLPADKQWVDLGEKLTLTKGCINCHAIDRDGKPRESASHFARLDEIRSAGAAGCIGESPDSAYLPAYRLEPAERTALAAFLKTGLTGAGSPAPTYTARTALRRFNCLNCHGRDGEGGIPTGLAEQMRVLERVENVDDVRPPLLTGVGHKARTSWLKSVLTDRGRGRPWMQLRMPQYGPVLVGHLPDALAHLEGAVSDDTIRKLPISTEKIAVGREIIGKGGLGCISCHDIGGVPNTGTRGPDLATIKERVRYEWYERWLHQPLRMAPGTRMPQAFVDGKSTLTTVLGGDPTGQAEAMWSYLSLGPGLPLPDGLEPPKGLIVAVKDRAAVLRTFMPDAGAKAIAVGYPGGVNLAFSADECRLAYAWAGNFLDASPVWNNRGGAPARLLGPKFWTAPAGHPWGLTTNPRIPPDFLGRSKNPAFGTPLPQEPARIHDGPMAVQFDGYSLDRSGRPTLRYTLDEGGRGAVLTVAESFTPVKASAATGLTRHLEVEVPGGGYHAWLLAGQTVKEPRVMSSGNGETPRLDLTADEPLVPAAGVRIVLPQDGDRALVLEAAGAPEGSAWRFTPRPDGGWFVVLRLPEVKWKGSFDLVMWALPKDDDALLKGLK